MQNIKNLWKGKNGKGKKKEKVDASFVIGEHTEIKPSSIFSPDNNNKDFFGRPRGSTNLEKKKKRNRGFIYFN